MITVLLLMFAPAGLSVLIGVLGHFSSVMVAGICATLIVAASLPFSIAALRNHRSLIAAAVAMSIRLGGLAVVASLCARQPQAFTIDVTVATCLFINVVIDGVLTTRSGERKAHG